MFDHLIDFAGIVGGAVVGFVGIWLACDLLHHLCHDEDRKERLRVWDERDV